LFPKWPTEGERRQPIFKDLQEKFTIGIFHKPAKQGASSLQLENESGDKTLPD